MADFEELRDIFEMAEILTGENESHTSLEVQGIDEKTGKVATIVFNFNTEGELTDEVTVIE